MKQPNSNLPNACDNVDVLGLVKPNISMVHLFVFFEAVMTHVVLLLFFLLQNSIMFHTCGHMWSKCHSLKVSDK